MAPPKRLLEEDIARDLMPLELWREQTEVARCAVQLLEIYREIAPLGRRLLQLPPAWTDAYPEVLLLFRHLAETLGGMRPQARFILEAFAEEPEDIELPEFAPRDLLASMIRHLDELDRVADLTEEERSLLPLHLAEIAGEAEEISELEKWLSDSEERAEKLPAFLWKLGTSLEYHLARSHIFDKSKSELGVLTIIDRLLEMKNA